MTKTDNEIIAEFMGLPLTKSLPSFGSGEWVDVPFQNWKYDTSWDWLMPVVEKIEKHGAIVELNICLATMCRIVFLNGSRDKVKEFVNGGSIPLLDATYLSVVEFINWYNSNKPTEV
jgi:hypothetical protein